jgi:hypothetical protein
MIATDWLADGMGRRQESNMDLPFPSFDGKLRKNEDALHSTIFIGKSSELNADFGSLVV